MDIANAQYENDLEGNLVIVKATIDGQKLFVPIDPANRHYIAILEWAKEDSNEIQAAE
jgi:hypothetical protein